MDLGSTGYPRGSLRNRLHQIGQASLEEEEEDWCDEVWVDPSANSLEFEAPPNRGRKVTVDEMQRLESVKKVKKRKAAVVDVVDLTPPIEQTNVKIRQLVEERTNVNVRQLVEVMKEIEKEQRLLELVAEYQGQILLLTNTKSSCEKLGVMLAGRGEKCEFVHNALMRDKKDAALTAFREHKCRILVATHPNLPVGSHIDLSINFDFPEEGIAYYVARAAKARELSATMVSFFKEADGRNANALIRTLRAANETVPLTLEQLDRGEFGSLSKSEMRQGKARELELPLSCLHKPEVIVLDSAVRDAPTRADAKLSFIFLVSGPPHDRTSNDCFSSWVLPDHGFRQRRDGLARCILASLWGRPPWLGRGTGKDASATVFTDCECYLIFDQVAPLEEGKAAVVRLESDFVRAVGRTSADESTLLQLLDKAIRGVVAVPGVTVNPSFPSVRAASLHILRNISKKKSLVMELHDSLEQQLPVYGFSKPKKNKLLHVVVVLGCVDDHLENVNTVLATANELGLPRTRVNLGPRSEMSSKVVDIIQSHHCAGRLLPALRTLRKSSKHCVEVSAAGGEAKGLCGRITGLCVLNLHFWIFVPGVQALHLPTQTQCREINPVLTPSHRPVVWRLSNLVLSAIAKSHGAYDRDPSIRLSFVLADGSVVTVGAELIQKHLGERKWGALTEHHVLVGLRDAMAREGCVHSDFSTAFKHWGEGGTQDVRAIVVLPSDAPELQVYASSESCHSKSHPSRLHVLFPSAEQAVPTMLKHIPTARCCLPQDCWNRGRAITALQSHNNCGRLCQAIDALFAK